MYNALHVTSYMLPDTCYVMDVIVIIIIRRRRRIRIIYSVNICQT